MNSNDFGSAKTPTNGKASDTHTHGDCEKSKDSSGVSMPQAGPQGKSATDDSSASTDKSPDIRFRFPQTATPDQIRLMQSATHKRPIATVIWVTLVILTLAHSMFTAFGELVGFFVVSQRDIPNRPFLIGLYLLVAAISLFAGYKLSPKSRRITLFKALLWRMYAGIILNVIHWLIADIVTYGWYHVDWLNAIVEGILFYVAFGALPLCVWIVQRLRGHRVIEPIVESDNDISASGSRYPAEKDNCQTQASSSYSHGGWPHPSRSTWPSQDKATGGIGSVLGACTLVVKRIFVMRRSRFAVLLIVLLAAVFAYTVWPTPWRYEHANIRGATKLVKMHRITGETEVLDARGWYRLRSREQ